MTSSKDELYFERRERHCRVLAETHSDPSLRRVYHKFAENYAKELRKMDQSQRAPSRPRADEPKLVSASRGEKEWSDPGSQASRTLNKESATLR